MTAMTITDIKNYLTNLTGHITFEYNGTFCGVDPIRQDEFDMWYGDKEITAKSIEEVFETPFFDGKALDDILEDVTDLDF